LLDFGFERPKALEERIHGEAERRRGRALAGCFRSGSTTT
jgi:hypothetical protein